MICVCGHAHGVHASRSALCGEAGCGCEGFRHDPATPESGCRRDEPPYEVSDRGFVHWTPVQTTYGDEVAVYESSAAHEPCVWLSLGKGQTENASRSAHLTYEQALQVHARIGAWLDRHRHAFATAKADEYAAGLAAELGVPWSGASCPSD